VKRLIVTADDFGLCPSVSRAILEAHRQGIVTSASILANAPGFEEAASLAREAPGLAVGVHLNLTRGRPVSRPAEVPSLVREDGAFARGARGLTLALARGRLALQDVRQEWAAQIARARAAGIVPTHLDAEQHVHLLPPLFRVVVGLAQAEGILAVRAGAEEELLARLAPANPQWYKAAIVAVLGRRARRRAALAGLRVPDRLLGIVDGGRLDGPRLERLLARLAEGLTELIAHPGSEGAELREVAGSHGAYSAPAREAELRALTAPGLRPALASRGIDLVHYGMLSRSA
jgi:predicted glycoside hydrolase/deacetylase ChbG (UPF0249 family)